MSGKFALVIGNTEYTDPGLAQLTAPSRDVEDFGRVLKEPDLCRFDDVKVFLNQTESIVREAIDEFFEQKKPDDLLVLYFSGHGVRDEVGSLYLAVKNTNRYRLRSTAIKSDFIKEAMDGSRSKRQVLILDCCNSGAFSQGTKAATGTSIGTATAFESGFGRVILTASDSTQFAWEGDKVIGETDNSLFTHYLVEGLKGEADRDGDGHITVDELYDYAYEKVRLATPKQTPSKFSTKQQGEIVLRQNVEIKQPRIAPPLSDDQIAAIKASLITQVVDEVQAKLEAERLAKEKASEKERLAEGKRLAEEKAEAGRKAKKAADRIARQRAEEARLAEEERIADEKAKVEQAKKERARIAVQKAEAERIAKQKATKPKENRLKTLQEAEERVAQEAAETATRKKTKAQRLAREIDLGRQPLKGEYIVFSDKVVCKMSGLERIVPPKRSIFSRKPKNVVNPRYLEPSSLSKVGLHLGKLIVTNLRLIFWDQIHLDYEIKPGQKDNVAFRLPLPSIAGFRRSFEIAHSQLMPNRELFRTSYLKLAYPERILVLVDSIHYYEIAPSEKGDITDLINNINRAYAKLKFDPPLTNQLLFGNDLLK